MENIASTIKLPSIIAKKWKKFLFSEEKSLVGLPPNHSVLR
jgi:hypothetical protein